MFESDGIKTINGFLKNNNDKFKQKIKVEKELIIKEKDMLIYLFFCRN